MAAPTFLTSTPADNATGVGIEQVISVTFSTAIKASSVTAATFQVFRSDDQVPLRGKHTISGATVTFISEKALHENTLYKITLIGSDKGLGYAIQSTGSEFFATTLTLSFRTGTERFVSITEIADRDDIARVGPIREQDPLAIQPTGGILEIDLVYTIPHAFDSDVLIETTGFHISFDRDLRDITVTPETVVVTQMPVLGMEDYYATIPAGETTPKLATELGVILTPPPISFEINQDVIYGRLDPNDNWLYNTEVHIRVTTRVEGSDGSTLLEDYQYFFTTKYYPLFASAGILRLELGPAVASLTDDTLKRILHKNSIEAWELSQRSISLSRPTWWARKWVICKSVLDTLDVLLLTHDLASNESKQLGDLSITRRPSDPKLGAKYGQAVKCIESLGNLFDGDLLAAVAIKGVDSGTERADFRMRTWDHLLLSAMPSANSSGERFEKARLSADYSLGSKDITTQQYFLAIQPVTRHSIS